MNDCWKSKSEDDIKIYFSEDKESNRRFLFRAKLEVTGEISYEFSLDELGDVSIYFDNYKKKYPGEYIGLSEEEYNIFTELSCYDGNDAIKVEICDCLRSETEYSFLVFQGVEIYYYDENNTKYKVEWDQIKG